LNADLLSASSFPSQYNPFLLLVPFLCELDSITLGLAVLQS
jgi:hypothetical protein